MGDRIIVTDDKPEPAPKIVVVEPRPRPQIETVKEKTVIVEKVKEN
jgi:hypothetical protein